ncbi:kinase-like protein [Peniophora sp. CONT]|nr:kinase-like protein [Peniophora sp. CONT]
MSDTPNLVHERLVNGTMIILGPIGEGFQVSELKGPIEGGLRAGVYNAIDTETLSPVALKMEPDDRQDGSLSNELAVYRQLDGCTHIPRLIWSGQHFGHSVLALQLLEGPSLEAVACAYGWLKPWPVADALLVALNMLDTLEEIHARGVAHGDLHLANFVIPSLITSDPSESADDFLRRAVKPGLRLLDFGLSAILVDQDERHVAQNDEANGAPGAHIFRSRRTTGRFSRRDDLESLTYMLIHLLVGGLPWTSEKTPEGIAAKKLAVDPQVLCADLPTSVYILLEHATSLDFDAMPNYQTLKTAVRYELYLTELRAAAEARAAPADTRATLETSLVSA